MESFKKKYDRVLTYYPINKVEKKELLRCTEGNNLKQDCIISNLNSSGSTSVVSHFKQLYIFFKNIELGETDKEQKPTSTIYTLKKVNEYADEYDLLKAQLPEVKNCLNQYDKYSNANSSIYYSLVPEFNEYSIEFIPNELKYYRERSLSFFHPICEFKKHIKKPTCIGKLPSSDKKTLELTCEPGSSRTVVIKAGYNASTFWQKYIKKIELKKLSNGSLVFNKEDVSLFQDRVKKWFSPINQIYFSSSTNPNLTLKPDRIFEFDYYKALNKLKEKMHISEKELICLRKQLIELTPPVTNDKETITFELKFNIPKSDTVIMNTIILNEYSQYLLFDDPVITEVTELSLNNIELINTSTKAIKEKEHSNIEPLSSNMCLGTN